MEEKEEKEQKKKRMWKKPWKWMRMTRGLRWKCRLHFVVHQQLGELKDDFGCCCC
jgi:hypothetical protein